MTKTDKLTVLGEQGIKLHTHFLHDILKYAIKYISSGISIHRSSEFIKRERRISFLTCHPILYFIFIERYLSILWCFIDPTWPRGVFNPKPIVYGDHNDASIVKAPPTPHPNPPMIPSPSLFQKELK